MDKSSTLRITVTDLPAREGRRTDDSLNRVLHRLGADEGAACELNCDCRIGLLCVDGVCTASD